MSRARLSTGARLIALLTFVVAVGFGIAGWSAVRIAVDEQREQLDRSLLETLGAAEPLETTLTAQQRAVLENVPGSQLLVRLDAAGNPVDELFGSAAGDLLPDLGDRMPAELLTTVGTPSTTTSASGEPVRVVLRASDGGYVLAAASLADVIALEDRLGNRLALMGALLLAVLALAISVSIGTILSPLRRMIHAATRISGGERDTSLSAPGGATEVRELGTALETMRAALVEQNVRLAEEQERTRRVAAEASHELRTPLATIRGYADLHRQGALDGAATERAWERVHTEAERMSHLVDALLLLDRLDRDDSTAHELCDLDVLADEALDAARRRDPDRRYARAGPHGPALVDGDEHQLRQVLDNVLANVAEHTPAGTSATAALHATAVAVRLTVDDDGPGLQPDELAAATERFWRRPPTSSRRHGSGLGLAIVDGIVRAHGGHLWLERSCRGGLRAVVELPAARPRPGDPDDV